METVPIDSVPTFPERRRFNRVPLNKPVSLHCGGRMVSGTCYNLSGNGVLLSIHVEHTWVGRSMERSLVLGATLRVFLPTVGGRGDMQSVNALGKIVRVNREVGSDEVFVGLAFE